MAPEAMPFTVTMTASTGRAATHGLLPTGQAPAWASAWSFSPRGRGSEALLGPPSPQGGSCSLSKWCRLPRPTQPGPEAREPRSRSLCSSAPSPAAASRETPARERVVQLPGILVKLEKVSCPFLGVFWSRSGEGTVSFPKDIQSPGRAVTFPERPRAGK